MLGKWNIIILGQFDIELILLVITYSQTITAQITASSNGRSKSMLVEIVGIEDIEFGMNLLWGMGAEFKFPIQHILHHLKHTILHLFGIIRMFNILLQQP